MDEKLQQDLAAGRCVRVRPLARAAGFAPGTLYNAIKAGELKAVRVGKSVRITPSEARRVLGLDEAA